MFKMIIRATLAMSLGAWLFGSLVSGQTLDVRAWSAVWDRLTKNILPQDTPTESVHALTVIVPATWAKRDRAGLRELQTYAGALPDTKFSIDPSRLKLSLHQAYARFVLDADLPLQTPAQQENFEAAKTRYGAAFDAYLKRLDEYEV